MKHLLSFFYFFISISFQQATAQTITEIEANGRSYSQIFDSLS